MHAAWWLLLLVTAGTAPRAETDDIFIAPSCVAAVRDCTPAVMRALDTAGAAGGGTVVLAPRPNSLPWTITDRHAGGQGVGLRVGSNHSHVRLVLQRGVVVQAQRGAFKPAASYLLLIQNATNFTLSGYGATLSMWRQDYNDSTHYVPSGDRHGIMIAGSSEIIVEGVTVDRSGGDGIIIAVRKCAEDGSEPLCWRREQMGFYPQSRNITVRDCTFSRNRRQGMTVESAENLLVSNCLFNSTGSEGLGTDPMAGVDIEPPYRAVIRNITFQDCRATANTGCGYSVYLAEYNVSHGPVDITFTNCSVTGTGTTKPNNGIGQAGQAGYVFGALYPGMVGNISVRGGKIERTRLAAIAMSDVGIESIHINISDVEIEDVALAPNLCDGPCNKPSFPANALVTPVSLLWRTDHPRKWAQGGVTITNLRIKDFVKRPFLQVLGGPAGWRDLRIQASVENPNGCTELLDPNNATWSSDLEVKCTAAEPLNAAGSPPPPPPPSASWRVKGSNCGGPGCHGTLCECVAVTVMSAETETDKPFLKSVTGLHIRSFRIPSIVSVPGVLVAFAEARQGAYGNGSCVYCKGGSCKPCSLQPTDDLGPKTIAYKRSTDSGRTWGALSFIPGLYRPGWVVGQPTAVYDGVQGLLVLHVLNSTLLPAPFNDSMTNLGFTLQTTSSDHGRTWTQPFQLNPFLGPLHGLAPGPGNAIQLQSGRLLVPAWSNVCYDAPSCKNGTYGGQLTFAAVYYSDTHGKSWSVGAGATVPRDLHGPVSEPSLAELSNGSILMSLRNVCSPASGGELHNSSACVTGLMATRMASRSDDAGLTFGPASFVPDLPSPNDQGSMLRHGEALLFSGPYSKTSRSNISIMASLDGNSWPVQTVVYPMAAKYTCLAGLNRSHVSLLMERHNGATSSFDITFTASEH